jgi:cytochrome c-type biogenesis protein CcmH
LLLWILFALMTAAAIMAVLVPLGRAPREVDSAASARRVYADQLKELERDRAEGRISVSEAEVARTEVARRLIAVGRDDGNSETALAGSGPVARRTTAFFALVGIPVLSLSLYLALGAPNLPGQPLAARLSTPTVPNDIETLVAKVEEHLAKSPEDGRGWEVVAPVYLRMGRADDAVTAYRNAIRLLGPTAERQTGLGEAIFTAEGGIVTADARNAFEAARLADPQLPSPRYYLGLAAEQEGKREDAASEWRAMLASAPADAPWRALVEEALARVDTTPDEPGPSRAEITAAEDMAPAERTAMIEGMVGGLAERLKHEPDDVEGWLRLIRSYVVLGRPGDAAAAAQSALAVIKDAAGRKRLLALIADLRVKQTEGSVE